MSEKKITIKLKSEKNIIYYGETICQCTKKLGQSCSNYAYYWLEGKYVCGVHSSKKFDKRVELPKNPNKKQNAEKELKAQKNEIDVIAQTNKDLDLKGKIVLYKMRMMKAIEYKKGFLNIFPNFRHGNRKDGIGFPSLSPMSLGPIDHGQDGLPTAKNLENFHQANKVFPLEVDEIKNPLPSFYKTQIDLYNDNVPHRHKQTSKNQNIPIYSLWKGKRMTYVESRQFYCNFYEKLVNKLPDYKKLLDLIKNGYNLQICGYDAYVPSKSLEEHYLDASQPFGHELVLYTMLTMTEENYPWKKYKTENF